MEKKKSFYEEKLLYHIAELLYEEEYINEQELQKLKAFIRTGVKGYAESRDL